MKEGEEVISLFFLLHHNQGMDDGDEEDEDEILILSLLYCHGSLLFLFLSHNIVTEEGLLFLLPSNQ